MLNKKVALITGASSGMGFETALNLLSMGYVVYGGARRVEQMKEIVEHGGYAMALDVTSEESMTACVRQIIEKEKHIDILVNNAGYGSCGSIEEVPLEEVKRQYDVNVFGLGRMTQLVLPYMRKQRSGRIVNVASMGGRFTTPYCGWYHSTKYAVEAISDALRMEVNPFGIDVIVIEPGLIQTNWGIIAGKNIRKVSGDGDYSVNADKAAQYYEARYGNQKAGLTDPKIIAGIICKAIVAKRPKTRYLVGKNAKSFVFLKNILSDRAFQSVTMKSMHMVNKL